MKKMYLVLLSMSLALSACADSKKNKTKNSDQPTAAIQFPISGAISEYASVVVRGTASDKNGIHHVSVNGQNAYVEGDKWWAEMALVPGDNTFQVSVTDSLQATTANADSVTVNYFGPIVQSVRDFAYDSGKKKLYLLNDNSAFPIVEYDIVSKMRRGVFAESSTLPNVDIYNYYDRIELNNDGTQLFYTHQDSLYKLDLAGRSVSKLPDDTSFNPSYSGIESGFYATGGTAYFLTDGRFIQVNAQGTARKIVDTGVADATCPLTAQRFTVDASQTPARIYYSGTDAASGLDSVFAMNSDGGNCAVLSPAAASDPAIGPAGPFIVDRAGDRLLAYNATTQNIVAIALADGSRSLLTDSGQASYQISGVADMKIDTSVTNRRLLLLRTNSIDAVDLVALSSAAQVAAIAGGVRLAIEDSVAYIQTSDSIYSVATNQEPATSLLLLNLSVCGGHTSYNNSGLYVDSTANRLVSFINDGSASDIKAISLADTTRCATISSQSIGSTIFYSNIVDTALDAGHNRFLVTTNAAQVIAVDTASGARSILSNAGFPGSATDTSLVHAVAVDANNNSFLSLSANGTIMSATLGASALGLGQLLSDNTQNIDIILNGATGLAIQSAEALLVSSANQIMQVSRTDGSKTIIADNSNGIRPNIYMYPGANKLVFNGDATSPGVYALQGDGAVMLVDVKTGRKEILNIANTRDSNISGNYAYSKADDKVYYYDYNRNSIFYAPVSAPMQFTELADAVGDNTAIDFSNPRNLQVSADGKSLFIVNNSNTEIPSLLRIDTASGDRSEISTLPIGDYRSAVLLQNRTVLLQNVNNAVSPYALVVVDLTKQNTHETLPLLFADHTSNIYISYLVAANEQLYAVSSHAIYAVDGTSGVATTFLGANIGDSSGIRYSNTAVFDEPRHALLVNTDDALVEIPVANPTARKTLVSYHQFRGLYDVQALTRKGDTVLFFSGDWAGQHDLISHQTVWLYFYRLPNDCYDCSCEC